MGHYDTDSYSVRTSIGYLMRRGASLMRNELDRSFARHDLTFLHWAVLRLIRDDPAATATDLCRNLQHDSGAFTRLLDQLEERGLLRRERGDADRRTVRLFLTAGGRRVVESMLPIVVERLNHLLADFSAAEVATLTRLLLRLIERLELCDAENSRFHQKGARS
jgi:DNA-binding MarR family transcriptional regulator